MRRFHHPVDEGAVEDLGTGSLALKQMLPTTNLPVHATVGVGGSDLLVEGALEFAPPEIKALWDILAFFGIHPLDIFASIEFDGVVGRVSQEGGLPASAVSSPVHGVEGVHVLNTSSTTYSSEVVRLLETPPSGGAWADLPAPSPFSSRLIVSSANVVRVEELGGLQLTVSSTTVPAGGTFSATVTPPPGVTISNAMVVGEGFVGTRNAAPFAIPITISSTASGVITFAAAAKTADGTLYYSPEVSVTVRPSEMAIDRLTFDSSEVPLYHRGDTANLHLVAFEGNQPRTISSGVIFESSDAATISVSAEGVVTAVRAGYAVIRATYKALTAEVGVRVLSDGRRRAVAH